MNNHADAQVVDRVRDDFHDLQLTGPGPDLQLVRRRGTARRRRRQTLIGAGAAAALSVASLAVVGLNQTDRGTGSIVAATPEVTKPAQVGGIFHAALDEAGIAYPPAEGPGVVVDGDTRRPVAWTMTWHQTDTDPKTAVEVSVHPEGSRREDPCSGPSSQVRACTQETLPDGVRLVAAENGSGGFVNGADRWTMWSPQAMATYPDGRQVFAAVHLLHEEDDRVPHGVVTEDYPGPVTLDQLRSLVQNPKFAEIGQGTEPNVHGSN